MQAALVDWAAVLAALGWLHAGWAALWPWLFARDFVRHGQHVPEGFQIGRAIVWRLPVRAAAALALLWALPLAAVRVLPAGWAAAALGLGTLLALAEWLVLSPGSRFVLDEVMAAGEPPAYRLRRPLAVGRALTVLIALGVAPALLIGWALARVVG